MYILTRTKLWVKIKQSTNYLQENYLNMHMITRIIYINQKII